MATVTVTLDHGYPRDNPKHHALELREVTVGDIIDGQAESERVVPTPEGPALVISPTFVGLNTLRRQIVRIGDIEGPLSLKELRNLHPDDLHKVQQEADRLEGAAAADLAPREVAQRGRAESASGGNRTGRGADSNEDGVG
ncbi:MAG: phage tail assembly protein [Aquisalimonadaceae bacterium]